MCVCYRQMEGSGGGVPAGAAGVVGQERKEEKSGRKEGKAEKES